MSLTLFADDLTLVPPPSAKPLPKAKPDLGPRRAYKVTDGGDRMEIVFAASPGQAKRIPDWWCEVDWTDLTARRAPAFDDADDPPTPEQYLKRGWYVLCAWCERPVDQEYLATNETDAGTDAGEATLFTSKSGIQYAACSAECLARFEHSCQIAKERQ